MDFVRDYMRALLAKEIDVAAALQKQRSQVVYQQYCAGGTIHCVATIAMPIKHNGRSPGRQHKTRPPLQEAAAGGKTFSHIRL